MKTKPHNQSLLLTGLLITVSLLAGCSGLRTYPNTSDKNLQIRTETDSGSIFSNVRASLHIYRVDADCKTRYEGTIKLNKPLVEVGIPSGRTSYMVFNFSGYSFLANSSHSIDYNTVLKPRAGYSYNIEVRYIDDIYNVAVHEAHPGKAAGREIERIDLSACNDL
jgi:hypothetical protein